jgi:SWI/SNF-related matrix-associated actin-dependent regulator 1 of chromatin subfamily A
MKAIFDDTSCTISFPYDEKMVRLCRVLGGVYDGSTKSWVVEEPIMIEMVRTCAEVSKKTCRPLYDLLKEDMSAIIDRSMTSQDIRIGLEVPPGLTPTQPQYTAVSWIINRRSTLEGDSMGAGKTIMCALAAQKLARKRVLVIVIASSKANWRREWRKWCKMAHDNEQSVACAIGSFWPDTDVVIVNFDILERFRTEWDYDKDTGEKIVVKEGQIDAVKWDMVVIDEAHRIKGIKAQRTHAIIGDYRRGKCYVPPMTGEYKVAMTGTPIPNRPAEIWPILHWLWPKSFPNFHTFGMRYCGAKKRGNFGWDFKGSSNELELNSRVRLLGMISRPKSITHLGLPAKTRKIIEFEIPGLASIIEKEKTLLDEISNASSELRTRAELAVVFNDEVGFRAAMKELRSRVTFDSGDLIRARLEVARAALPQFIEHIKQTIQDVGKIVVFGWHQEVVDKIAAAIPGCIKIHGSVPTEDRQALIDRFQNEPDCTMAVGTIGAMGTSVTLTAAHVALFVEYSWVPGDMAQAEDRLHRITLKHPVEIQYGCVAGSASALMASRLIDKTEVAERCVGPIHDMLEQIPVSASSETEDGPASSVPYTDLESMAGGIDAGREPTIRESLTRVARGQVKGRLHSVDQLVAGSLCGLAKWTPVMHVMAELVVKKYIGSM